MRVIYAAIKIGKTCGSIGGGGEVVVVDEKGRGDCGGGREGGGRAGGFEE